VAGAGDCLRCFAALIWRGRMLVSLEGTAVGFLLVLAGQALIGSLAGPAGRYSGKVPADGMQEVRGSNPLSSTGQSHNSKAWARVQRLVQQQVQQRRLYELPHTCSDRAFTSTRAAGMACEGRTLRSALSPSD